LYQANCIREPLVDIVESKAIVSESSKVYEVDLKTCTINDLDFKVDYEITFLRDDYVHALIAWFDIEFSSCPHPVTFSTGPFSKYTHWKQTVFYLEDILSVSRNEVITGHLKSTRNRENPRDLDIEILYNFQGGYSNLYKIQYYQLK